MSNRESSAAAASKASEIMSIARNGGPIKHFEEELRAAFATTGGGDDAVLEKVQSVLQPYFDFAESVAASVLTQRERP